jgi:hypothetical protein
MTEETEELPKIEPWMWAMIFVVIALFLTLVADWMIHHL